MGALRPRPRIHASHHTTTSSTSTNRLHSPSSSRSPRAPTRPYTLVLSTISIARTITPKSQAENPMQRPPADRYSKQNDEATVSYLQRIKKQWVGSGLLARSSRHAATASRKEQVDRRIDDDGAFNLVDAELVKALCDIAVGDCESAVVDERAGEELEDEEQGEIAGGDRDEDDDEEDDMKGAEDDEAWDAMDVDAGSDAEMDVGVREWEKWLAWR